MSFLIEGDKRCPRIEVNTAEGLIEISGISLPENPYNYYLPLHKKLDEYIKNPQTTTKLNFRLEYFNTGSALALRNTIQKLCDELPENSLMVKWYYEEDDVDMLDSGEEFATIFPKANFEIIEVEEFE
ncbi:MAG: DUF1987 domain-containing protein [Crocinitomicaceae bacterium]